MPRGIHDKFVAVLFAWTCGFARIYSFYPHTMKVTLLQQGGQTIEWPSLGQLLCAMFKSVLLCAVCSSTFNVQALTYSAHTRAHAKHGAL